MPTRDLFPDDHVLHCIFPELASVKTTLLSQTFETCTFVAHVSHVSGTTPAVSEGDEVVVRLEISQSNASKLRTVAALQAVAALVLPHLVPEVKQTGTARTQDGTEVEFSVIAFIADSVTLEAVWDDLTDLQQSGVVEQVVSAMEKMYRLSASDKAVQEILQGSGFYASSGQSHPDSPVLLGGPDIGFFQNVSDMLTTIIDSQNSPGKPPVVRLDRNAHDDTIIVKSSYEDFPEAHIPRQELVSLGQHRIVFCHNDLEPRNILVHCSVSHDGDIRYDVKAIIDWEMSGFFPLGYEYVMKDNVLGGSNQYFSWYALFKQHAARLLGIDTLPRCQKLFMEAVDVVHSSRHRRLAAASNVGELVQDKWIRREQLVRGPHIWSGWTRETDAKAHKYTKEDNEALLVQVLKELGKI